MEIDDMPAAYTLTKTRIMELAGPATIPYTHTKLLIRQAFVFFGFLGIGQLAHLLVPESSMAALIWPPAGVALAGVVLGGYQVWPAIFLASVTNNLLNGTMVSLTIALALGNTLQAVFGGWLFRVFKFELLFDRLQDAMAIAFVAMVASTIVPTFRIAALYFLHIPTRSGLWPIWTDWWTGEILSLLVIAPFLMRWIYRPRFHRTSAEWLENLCALILLVATDFFLFWTPYSQFRSIPLVYFILVPLFWIALRLGPRAMTLALLLNATILLIGTALGYGNAAAAGLGIGDRLFQDEVFTIIITFMFLMLCSLAEERKQAAKALEGHVGRLEDIVAKISREDEAKGRFIATLAHELRNPLAPLLSSLELITMGGVSPEESAEVVSQMNQNVRTMRHLLDDLLDISRISRNKLTLQKEHVDLHAVVNQALSMVSRFMEDQNHTLIVTLPEKAVLFEADPVRLEQIIVNLLNNAAKYTPPGGTIEFTVEARPSTIAFIVKDNGIGISEEMIDRIFEPFLQIEDNTRKVSGLGIGLSLTKNLVDMHGGTIRVQSEGLGKGSMFTVELPFTNLAAPMTTAASARIPRKLDILVVDDNRPGADGIKKLLQLRGHTVEALYDGTSALTHVKKHVPDVILLDIGLPDIEGYEVASTMRSRGVDSILIALTGYGQDSDRRKAEAAGFNHHITKPVALAELEEVLAEIPDKE